MHSCTGIYEKEGSPLIEKLWRGDQLVAVDFVDVREMESYAVTKLITDRETNPARRLRVLRV